MPQIENTSHWLNLLWVWRRGSRARARVRQEGGRDETFDAKSVDSGVRQRARWRLLWLRHDAFAACAGSVLPGDLRLHWVEEGVERRQGTKGVARRSCEVLRVWERRGELESKVVRQPSVYLPFIVRLLLGPRTTSFMSR